MKKIQFLLSTLLFGGILMYAQSFGTNNNLRVWQKEAPPIGSVIALKKSGGDKNYVTAEKVANDNQLLARSNKILEWERFEVESHPDGGVALKAQSNGKYIQVNDNNTDTPVKAKGASKGPWERFEWVSKGPGKVALKSLHSNKWLQCAWSESRAVVYPKGDTDIDWAIFDFTIVEEKE